MTQRLRRAKVAPFKLALAMTISLHNSVDAYDADGHDAIGMTAMSGIARGKVLNTVKRLLKGKDISTVSTWAHLVDDKYPWAQPMHYQKYKFPKKDENGNPHPNVEEIGKMSKEDKTKHYDKLCSNLELLVDEKNCEKNMCLTQSMTNFYGRLLEKPSSDLPSLDGIPNDVNLTDADMLKFLIGLMEDGHQPLHFVPDQEDLDLMMSGVFDDDPAATGDKPIISDSVRLPTDTAGKKIPVKMVNDGDTNLYDVWDTSMVQMIKKNNPSFWDGGWTSIHHATHYGLDFDLRETYEGENERFKKDPNNFSFFFMKWSKEAAEYACKNVYRDPLTSKIIRPGQVVSPKDLELWKKNMLERLLVAGARIAIVVNAIIQHRIDTTPEGKTVALKSGTSMSDVIDPQEEETLFPDHNAKATSGKDYWGRDRSRGNVHKVYLQNFGINFSIFCFELAGLLMFLKWTQPNVGKDSSVRFSAVQLADMKKQDVSVPGAANAAAKTCKADGKEG